MKWIDKALEALTKSLHPIPSERNEIDWKSGLSPDSHRLAQHICAFANENGGGFFAFGVQDSGVDFCTFSREEAEAIVSRLGSIAANNLSDAIKVEHEIALYEGHPILFVHIPEYPSRPIYLRGKDIYESYCRTAGQTRKMPRHLVGRLLAAQQGIAFESKYVIVRKYQGDNNRFLERDLFFRRENFSTTARKDTYPYPEVALRERLGVSKNNSAMISRLIRDAVEAGLIKASSDDNESRKFQSYIPYYR